MKKFNLIKLKKIKGFFKNLPKILGENAFLTFLGILLFSLILGVLIFYQYGILAQKEKLEDIEKPFKFKEKTYQTILKTLEEKREAFEGAGLKQYPNPFQVEEEILASPPELEEESEKETSSESTNEEIETLLAATNLFNFYLIKGEELPLASERAKIWGKKGLGLASEYYGSDYQNFRLLKKLKRELTD